MLTLDAYEGLDAMVRDDLILIRQEQEAAEAVQSGAFVPGRFKRPDSMFSESC